MYSIPKRLKQAAEKQKQHVPRSVAMRIFLVILLVICFKWFDFLEANQIKNKLFFSSGKSNQFFFTFFKSQIKNYVKSKKKCQIENNAYYVVGIYRFFTSSPCSRS